MLLSPLTIDAPCQVFKNAKNILFAGKLELKILVKFPSLTDSYSDREPRTANGSVTGLGYF